MRFAKNCNCVIFSAALCVDLRIFFAVVKDPRPSGKAVVKIHAQVIDLLRACEKTRKKTGGHALQHLSCLAEFVAS